MNYGKMSDFEINKAVAVSRGLILKHGGYEMNGKVLICAGVGDYWYDPCNNPADAWPVIMSVKGMCVAEDGEAWVSCSEFGAEDPNPLRAAMIVFLMTKESAQ